MPKIHEGGLRADGKRFAIIASRFNDFMVEKLTQGALDALRRSGADDDEIEIFRCPGAFEIPALLQKVADTGRFQGVICLGVVIRGGTPHFEYVCQGVTDGVREVMRDTGVPVAFGVLTTDDVESALDRAGGEHGNKGRDAAQVAVEMARLLPALRERPGGAP